MRDREPRGIAGERRILLVDCDMYFVQVAQLEDPDGIGREELVIVGGRPGSRGVVTSASYGCRAYGVHSAMPIDQAVRLCPAAVVVPVAREACSRRSREVRATLERFAPVVEAASIDEFYLDLSGTEALYGGESLAETARRIQRAVREETGIVVSAGGATQRMLAKLAVGLAKPAGVYVVAAGEEAEFMLRWAVADLPGIGPVLAETLARRGVHTVRDVLGWDEKSLRLWLGDARGYWLFQRARGIDPTPIAAGREAKSVSHERTFETDVLSRERLDAELLRLVTELAADLRRKELRAGGLRVYVRDRDWTDRQVSRTLAETVDTDRAILRVARPLLDELWTRRAVGVRLLGVGVTKLAPRGQPEQIGLPGLAPALETERDRRIARAADQLRARFGHDAILPGRLVKGGE